MAIPTADSPSTTMPSSSIGTSDDLTLIGQLRDNISAVVFGQEELITETLCAFLAGGHILMTGAPGLAKTTLVRVVSQQLGLSFGRIQFTPDLLPSDIVGSEILNIDQASGQRTFKFIKGPIFTNLLLADEINRASPRTQSALLEAMQEKSVTVAGTTYQLTLPFMVFATQNPFESEGTFALPEAQLDRFLIHTLVDYPEADAENRLLKAHADSQLVGEQTNQEMQDNPLITNTQVLQLIDTVRRVAVDDNLTQLVGQLVRSSRPTSPDCPENRRDLVWYGAGPRAGISLISVARALAFLDGRTAVRWSDVKRMARPTMRHRLKLSPAAARQSLSEDTFIGELLENIERSAANLVTTGEA